MSQTCSLGHICGVLRLDYTVVSLTLWVVIFYVIGLWDVEGAASVHDLYNLVLSTTFAQVYATHKSSFYLTCNIYEHTSGYLDS